MLLSPCLSTTTSSENCLCTLRLHDANYIWTINGFSSPEANDENILSPIFSSLTNEHCKWYLQLVPSDKNTSDSESEDDAMFLGLYLYLSSSSTCAKVCAKFSFSILNEKQEKLFSGKDDSVVFTNTQESLNEEYDTDVDDAYGYDRFCKKDELFRNTLLIDNKLTISCKMTFFEMSGGNLRAIFHRCNPVSLQHLAEDLALMRENKDLSDVILSVEGKDFTAHKGMLAARSKVFAAMFNHDTKENKENRVEIEDMNAEVAEEMLRFLYTGNCIAAEKLTGGLLAAAEKYDLDDLKKICAESLYRNLTIENAPRTLVLADTYHVNKLKSEVMDFIVAKSSEVVSVTTWNSIMPSYPLLLNEVLLNIIAHSRRDLEERSE